MRTLAGGEVVPPCAQFNAQHNFASATSGVCLWSSAALQQSIPSIISCMLHSPSPNLIGTPANAPPASTSKRTKDASRFFISNVTLVKTANNSQCLNSTSCGMPSSDGPSEQRTCRKKTAAFHGLIESLSFAVTAKRPVSAKNSTSRNLVLCFREIV